MFLEKGPRSSAGLFFIRLGPIRSSNYDVIMKASIIRIGNSRGVRIPKSFLDQAGLRDDVEIEVRGSQIVVRAPKNLREEWDEAFRKMAEAGDAPCSAPMRVR
jgi:antitoxin MazE